MLGDIRTGERIEVVPAEEGFAQLGKELLLVREGVCSLRLAVYALHSLVTSVSPRTIVRVANSTVIVGEHLMVKGLRKFVQDDHRLRGGKFEESPRIPDLDCARFIRVPAMRRQPLCARVIAGIRYRVIVHAKPDRHALQSDAGSGRNCVADSSELLLYQCERLGGEARMGGKQLLIHEDLPAEQFSLFIPRSRDEGLLRVELIIRSADVRGHDGQCESGDPTCKRIHGNAGSPEGANRIFPARAPCAACVRAAATSTSG
jgi:hypothetical protein